MPAHSMRSAAPLLVGVLWLACARDETTLLDPPSLARAQPHTISGKLLGPGGKNVCKTIGSGTMTVQLLNPDFGITSDNPFLGAQDVTCPKNSYSLPMDPGTAHLRVTLPFDVDLDGLPWRHLDDVEVSAEGLDHDVDIVRGTELGGSATLDGNPFEGVFLQFGYDFNGNFGATNATTAPDGIWTEFFGRSPTVLQTGVRYSAFTTCGSMLGTRLIAGLSSSSFEFPTELDAVNCTLETGAATRFSHTSTRLVVTPMPGDIGGGFSPEFSDRYGIGWGVQFPIARGAAPGHDPLVTELFNGGLLIGLPAQGGSPVRVLSGVHPGGEIECGATCRDLGLNGEVKFTTQSDGRRSVTWRYSDATSAEGAGLEVTQLSVDGKVPNDYVLFRFSIRNTSRSTLTFYAGFFGDWDSEFNAFDDLGFTGLGGKLMYQVSQAETGIHAGTLLLGAPATGNFFFDGVLGDVPSTADQIRALKGELRQETAGPGDLRYIHGAGPITLKKKEQRDIWVAIVAGENQGQLLANAAAAEADVARSSSHSLDGAGATTTITTDPVAPAAGRALTRPICKNCKLE
jgi:hypothetical protein